VTFTKFLPKITIEICPDPAIASLKQPLQFVRHYRTLMPSMKICSIRHKGLRRFLEKNDTSGLPQDRLERIRRMLTALINAASVEQMNTMPGWKLHPLKGGRAGTYAIAVSGNWRLTFWIKDNEIFDLDLEDYH